MNSTAIIDKSCLIYITVFQADSDRHVSDYFQTLRCGRQLPRHSLALGYLFN